MPLIPDLVLDEESTNLLCDERFTSLRQLPKSPCNNDTEPLNNDSLSNEPYVDITAHVHVSPHGHESSSLETTDSSPSLPAYIDIEAPADGDDCSVVSLGATSVHSESSLFYSPDEVHAFGKSSTVLSQVNSECLLIHLSDKVYSPRRVETIVEKTMKGAEKAVSNAVRHTEKAVKTTARETEKVVKKTARETEKVVRKTTKDFVNLPHEATSHWFHLSVILLLHAIGPVLLSMPTFLPNQHSVNLGLSGNRGFLYGTHTLVELFILAAFVSTCHYAIDKVEIPLKARAMAVFFGLCVGKLVLAFIAEAWWSPHADTVFPIPFSFIITTVVSLPFSLLTLRLMTPKHSETEQDLKVCKKFKLCYGTLTAYILSLLLACVWGIIFRLLGDRPVGQSMWVVALVLFEVVCKILLTTNLTTRLNSKKWIQLTLVVDLIFASVQTAMLPYFASWYSVMLSVFGTMGSIAWRAYGGVDRARVFYQLLRKTVTESSSGPAEKAREVGVVGMQIVRESTPNIHSMSLSFRLTGNGASMEREMEWAEERGQTPNDKQIERSRTAETESLDDCASQDSIPPHKVKESSQPKEPTTPETLSTSEESLVTVEDRRRLFANSKSKRDSQRNSQLIQTDGKQRHCYHIVDSVSSAVLVTVVRLAGLITSASIRSHTVRQHLNSSFQLDNKQYALSVVYALIFIIAIILVILGVGMYIQKGLRLGGLTLNRVISYVFRDSFWFMFFWFCIQQHFTIAIQLNHYGADFSMQFEWLTCREPGQMQWPGCVSMGPSV